jgi:hypothetical protein
MIARLFYRKKSTQIGIFNRLSVGHVNPVLDASPKEEAYLAQESQAECKSEYRAGETVAMS